MLNTLKLKPPVLLGTHTLLDKSLRVLQLPPQLTRQIHEGVYLNWLHRTILQLSHLFQIS